MSKYSKVVSLLLVGVMILGISLTAFAEESAKAKTDTEKAQEMQQEISSQPQVADGVGSVATITDEATLARGYEQSVEAESYVYGELAAQFDEAPAVLDTLYFDVQGVVSGDVTLKYTGSKDAAGKLAVVYHYNTSTGTWDKMSDLVEIDANGNFTINFNSYSPILVKILDKTKAALKSDASVGVKTVNMAARQAQTSESSTVKSAKMGQ